MLTSETLNRAADLIEQRGWINGTGGWGDEQGSRLCLEGAIAGAIGESPSMASKVNCCPAGNTVRSYLGMAEWTKDDWLTGDSTEMLWRWNDDDDRTAEQVIEVLRACAVIEAAKETADERVAVSA